MTPKIPRRLKEKILADLIAARNRDDIVREVCEELDLDWKQAEAHVKHLSAENEGRITLSQSPMLVLLALSTFLVGVGFVLYVLYQLYLAYSADSQTLLFQLFFLGMNGQALFWSFLLGVGMILGSLKGMESVWAAIFEWFDGSA